MITDSFFEIGDGHEVCEDYAVHGENYGIVSDGCSNGGGPRIDTDWGSRLLCKAAEDHIENHGSDWFSSVVCAQAAQQARMYRHVSNRCLLATLLSLHTYGGVVSGRVFGDGVLGARDHDGTWSIWSVEFMPGGTLGLAAPYYPYYMVSGETEKWAQCFGGSYRILSYSGLLTTLRSVSDSTGNVYLGSTPEMQEEWWFSDDTCDFAFIATDGLHSFYRWEESKTGKQRVPVDFLDVLGVLLDVKSFRPGFLRTQRRWCFRQDRPGTFKRLGWHHDDDVSMAAVYLGEQD